MSVNVTKAMGERLQKLSKAARGRISPPIVLEDARDPKSPLHNAFEWDDSIAGEKYRLEQAGDIIRCYKVETTVEEVVYRCRAFYPDPEANSGCIAITSAGGPKLQDKTKSAMVLDAVARATDLIRSVHTLSLVLGQREAVEQCLQALAAFKESLDE